MIRKLLTAVILFSSFSVLAQDDCPQDAAPSTAEQIVQHVQGCPNNSGLNAICSFVKDKTEDPTGVNKYRHQSVFKSAACVNPNDTKEQEAAKIRHFWNTYENQLVCNDITFTVTQGSIIKFAILKTNDQFIYDVTKKWKVNLNRIDPSDNQTVLDYAEKTLEKEKAVGSSLVPKIEMYIKFLKDSGAKRRNEL